MSEHVYTVIESVRYEGDNLLSIHRTEDGAREAAQLFIEEHRRDGTWETVSIDDDNHIITLRNGGVSVVVRRREVSAE